MTQNWKPDPAACLGSITWKACETCKWNREDGEPCSSTDASDGLEAYVTHEGCVYCDSYEEGE